MGDCLVMFLIACLLPLLPGPSGSPVDPAIIDFLPFTLGATKSSSILMGASPVPALLDPFFEFFLLIVFIVF